MERVIDPQSSFVTWRVDTLTKAPTTYSHRPPRTLNNARVPLDCITELQDPRTGTTDRLLLGVPCKTEQVGVATDMWLEPNADFVPIVGRADFLALKTYPRVGMGVPLYPPGSGEQPERHVFRSAEAFDAVTVHLAEVDAEPLEEPAAIVGAVLANRRLVARIDLVLEGLEAGLTLPVKTINVNERDVEYQIDTGPLVVPGHAPEGALITAAELCFVASNRQDYAELLLRAPTPAAVGVDVYHYSRVVKLPVRARYLALP